MIQRVIFVGDVHGNVEALLGLMDEVENRRPDSVVLLGDYINKGPHGAQVLEYLVTYAGGVAIHPLLGNHEEVFLRCLTERDVRPLLRMSGAPTIRSYVGADVGPDVSAALSNSVPDRHIEFLRSLQVTFWGDGVVASHRPLRQEGSFRVSAHVPAGLVPRISFDSAEIDTRCGETGGRLTAFEWPSREFFQVDDRGFLIDES